MKSLGFDPGATVFRDGAPSLAEAVLARDDTTGAYLLVLDLDDSSEIGVTLRADFLDALIAAARAAAAA